MITKVTSIYHLRHLRIPCISYLIIFLIIFMSLNFLVLNRKIVITKKALVIIDNQAFELDKNINKPIYYQDKPLSIKSKEVSNGIVTYRINNNLNGLVTITYEEHTNLFKLLKNL